MSGRQERSGRVVPGVWQRLPYGPAREGRGRGRRQARAARQGGPRLVLGGVGAVAGLLALAAGWAHV